MSRMRECKLEVVAKSIQIRATASMGDGVVGCSANVRQQTSCITHHRLPHFKFGGGRLVRLPEKGDEGDTRGGECSLAREVRAPS